MIERLQLLQTFCMIGAFIGALIVAFSGLGWNYYSREIKYLEGKQQKITTEKTTEKIIDSVHASSDKVINELKHSPKITQTTIIDNHKEEKIIAPNALIVTSNQSGGSNTVINHVPKPEVKVSWSTINEKTDKILPGKYSIKKEPTIFKDKYNLDYLYKNQFYVDFIL